MRERLDTSESSRGVAAYERRRRPRTHGGRESHAGIGAYHRLRATRRRSSAVSANTGAYLRCPTMLAYAKSMPLCRSCGDFRQTFVSIQTLDVCLPKRVSCELRPRLTQ